MKKKFFVVIMTAFIILQSVCLTGCTDSSSGSGSSSNRGNSQYQNTTQERTTTTTVAKEDPVWMLDYYVDDFQQPTDEWFVANDELFVGTFSNSATTNSKLTVQVAVDANYFTILLYEYGMNTVKNPLSHLVGYEVTLKDSAGNKYSGYASIIPNGDRLYLNEDTNKKAVQFLKNSKEVSFYISETDGMSSYLFTATSGNFAEMID